MSGKRTAKESCPRLNKVQDYRDDLLDPDSRKEFRAHLDRCSACQQELRQLLSLSEDLREYADQDLPPLDRNVVAQRLFSDERLASGSGPAYVRPLAWAGVASLAALIVLFLFLWPSEQMPVPSEALLPEPAQAPEPHDHAVPPSIGREPARVVFLRGEVEGPQEHKSNWAVMDGSRLRVADSGLLALRLDEHCHLALLGGGDLRLDRSAGWALKLEAGTVAIQLDPGRQIPFQVDTAAGRVEALGTRYSIEKLSQDRIAVVLIAGRLKVTPAAGAEFVLSGPTRVVLGPGGLLSSETPSAADHQPLQFLARVSPAGTDDWGTISLNSEPVAEVFDGDHSLGLTPLIASRKIGPWPMTLKADGYRSRQVAIAVEHLRLSEHRIELTPVPAPRPILPVGPTRAEILSRARKLLAARQVPPAIEELNQFLEQNPGDLRASFLLGDALRLAGKGGPAIEAYGRVVHSSQDKGQVEAALYQIGLLQLKVVGQAKRALATFQKLRREYPRGLLRQEVAFLLAESYLMTQDYRRALRAFQDYLRLFPAGTRATEARKMVENLEQKGWK